MAREAQAKLQDSPAFGDLEDSLNLTGRLKTEMGQKGENCSKSQVGRVIQKGDNPL